MFKAEMKDKLSKIFGFAKVTFDAPSMGPTGTFEQDTLFVEIDECPTRPTDGHIYAKVSGSLVVYSQMEKLPFGYFSKRISQAEFELKKNFFFFDIDRNPMNSPARFQNIAERRAKFIYLYTAQYDPAHGQLTNVTFGEAL